jgi:hypothetical protein
MRLLKDFYADCAGIMAAEYALMLGAFCLSCMCTAEYYSHQLSAAFSRISHLVLASSAG